MEEQRTQEVDAERRIKILRGLRVESPAARNEPYAEERHRGPGRDRKRRRIAGEDDTDRDIRLAKECDSLVPAKAGALVTATHASAAPLTDHGGHINLFPMESSRYHAPKNAEAEEETARKKREFEDQYTMRFSNAAGFKQAVGQKPWYQALDVEDGEKQQQGQTVSKDVWGNEDPRRKEREKMRMAADDPLAAIQRGVVELREVERERKRWKEEKERELRDLVEAERARHRRKRKDKDEDELEGFSLDAQVKSDRHRRHEQSHERRAHHRRRSRSRCRSRHRWHHHRHKSHGSRSPGQESNERSQGKGETRVHIQSDSDGSPASADPCGLTLRKERDARERAERSRAAALLSKSSADRRPGWEKSSSGRYSRQFAHA